MTTKVLKVVCAILIGMVSMVYSPLTVAQEADPFADYIAKHCKNDCVDPNILRMALLESKAETGAPPLIMTAIIHAESGFRQHALNTVNGRSVGLTQVQVKYHKSRFISRNHNDVFDNVRVGSEIYKECEAKHRGSTQKALWCFNGHTKQGLAKYVPKVMKYYHALKEARITF